MKAIVQNEYGTTDVLALTDLPEPEAGPDGVVVRIHAAGVDPGVWHLMEGRPYLVRLMGFGVRRPKARVRGLDFAGVVHAVGENVTGFRPGDEVFGTCQGSFAEYALTTVDKIARKPGRLGFEEAAAVPISAFTALQALRDRGGVQPRQKVLVIGAGGGVGTYAVQIAKAFGAEVDGVCGTGKVDLVRSLGADTVFDYTREDITGTYDLILDTAGNRSLGSLRKSLAPRGTLVIVGGEGEGKWIGPVGRNLRALLIGPFVKHRLRGLFSTENPDDLEALRALIEEGKLTPVIDRTYALADAPEAIRYVSEGHARGKVVITV
ncbi:NAD(P)-dependent alcohol dehydrogenase [Amycolatopsis regifaucium]|uniref:NAD(P)-dependent alcohol dehydrogenase n=1 Tax=Amycolatopsis regifaucium TaxID=546365 RepID=A0A154M6X3_9PSEU|nr:NAD(P)-dependent alcohol dehydrogenase [Amycolatopsis regifaucium]KZB80365.1 NADPH:quinone reductase [Amycolatopsis regifaucium]OKA05334.1 NAD(P)-dependent alcohol dehydrogenase [Amycolatopsis regifaucium]SFJ06197.1 NADPH:quinone reductase [Amycolatopsis regifaucium]